MSQVNPPGSAHAGSRGADLVGKALDGGVVINAI